jgi:hypothetical protein
MMGSHWLLAWKLGDNFVIVAQDNTENNVGFWVLMFVEGLHMVIKDMHVVAFGEEFPHGSQVIIGKYFNKQGRSLYSFVTTRNFGFCSCGLQLKFSCM